ncbi:ammonia-dependent NAD(+) synthetase [Bacillus spizizenii]|uniref:NH(3)-dependent NAD(+) synthetase n=2 Tax=Bacillus spizizenii TaxID=96241 RepID=A0A9Q4DPA2_BACSC|nr:ammonia-dependent NAD(+) synthetase [Bacillus spizizenii]KFI03975.1 NAD synthetase [Bacillus sp. BSC154]MDU7576728.1 ammonia-dependent NAD(+) synthetase [Bacillus subtilis]ADM36377.1 NAD synthetase [Bacillus spizizenii str. W23]AJW85833.1 NAD synthetase [Bacillus spizizenii]EFG90839.1 NAD synthetase [Bacillus spizizenii ATCC 6633 = JCM 2499]
MSMQEKIMRELHVKPSIDPKQEIEDRINFLKQYLKKTGAKGFVLGISGGQDSTLAGRLAQLAVERIREEGGVAQFIAVRLPHGTQQDEDDAQLALKFIKPDKSWKFDIKSTVSAFSDQYQQETGDQLTDFNKGNVKARTRMIAQYAIGGQEGLLVIGTDHAAEAVTGFFTKYGDGGADLLPLTGLTKRQGKSLLKELGAPERLYLKEPTADLLDDKPQQADETELGISYEEIDDYLEGKEVSAKVSEALENRFSITEHKRQVPASMFDDWWK